MAWVEERGSPDLVSGAAGGGRSPWVGVGAAGRSRRTTRRWRGGEGQGASVLWDWRLEDSCAALLPGGRSAASRGRRNGRGFGVQIGGGEKKLAEVGEKLSPQEGGD